MSTQRDRRWQMVTIVLLFVLLCVQTTKGLGNFSLPPLPPQPHFKASDVQYDDGGLGPLNDFARSFVDTSIPGGFPSKLVNDFVNGNVSFDGELIKKLLLDFIGYAIAIVLGLLFVLLFPIIGCCFCCCRNCCKACCDRPKIPDPKESCKKKVYGTIFFVLVVFTLTGNICVYVTNERISTALDKVVTTVNDTLDDVDTYLSATEKEIDQINVNFLKTTGRINDQLDSANFDQALSEFAVSSLTGGAVQHLQDSAKNAKDSVDTIQYEMKNVQTSVGQLNGGLPGAIQVPQPSVPPLPSINTSLMTDITVQLHSKIQGLTNNVHGQLDNAKTKVSDLKTQVTSVISGMKDTTENVRKTNLDSMKDTVSDAADTIKPYDHYRWIAGVSIASIISLIVGLQMFGLCLGIIGSCKSDGGTDGKGCASNSGGKMIVASIVFIFLFTWVLMLLTTLLFGVGALMERFFCQPIKDPDLTDINTIVNDLVDLKDTLQYTSEPPTVGDILSSCRENKAIYTALEVSKMGNLVDFGELENQINTAKQDMWTQLDTVLKNLTRGNFVGVNLIPPAAITSLDTLNSRISGIDIGQIENQISSTEAGINNIESQITAIPAVGANVHSDISAIKKSLKNIRQAVAPLKKLKSEIGPLVTDVKKQLSDATAKLQTGSTMTSISNQYINSTFDVVDAFYSFTKNAVYDGLGKCGPVWNLYNAIAIVSVCDYTVDSLNGFWFSLGWSIFFLVPSIVFGIKLSNLFRDVSLSGRPKWNDRNKVSPRGR